MSSNGYENGNGEINGNGKNGSVRERLATIEQMVKDSSSYTKDKIEALSNQVMQATVAIQGVATDMADKYQSLTDTKCNRHEAAISDMQKDFNMLWKALKIVGGIILTILSALCFVFFTKLFAGGK